MTEEEIKKINIPAMTWENYGTVWEIGHIKPKASFDFTDEKQVYEYFNYKNTRPVLKGKYLKDFNKLKQYAVDHKDLKGNK